MHGPAGSASGLSKDRGLCHGIGVCAPCAHSSVDVFTRLCRSDRIRGARSPAASRLPIRRAELPLDCVESKPCFWAIPRSRSGVNPSNSFATPQPCGNLKRWSFARPSPPTSQFEGRANLLVNASSAPEQNAPAVEHCRRRYNLPAPCTTRRDDCAGIRPGR